jgi:NIMA (never in mitosis gene a)-related kinase
VRSKNLGKRLLVAKKIQLGKLSEKEQKSAFREAELLKSLNHPNIVGYERTFIEDGQLVIVMEYCEGKEIIKISSSPEGDLSYHIKKRKHELAVEHFPEKLILNWFLQLLFALEYIHSKKILHRDIKTSNIFLTSNGTGL